MKNPFVGAALVAVVSFLSISARADGPMIVVNPTSVIHPDTGPTIAGVSLCGPFDPNCAKRVLRILTGIHVAPIQIGGGARFGQKGASAAISFKTSLVATDTMNGDLRALMFDAVYMPDLGGFRLRFTLADTDVLLFCKDDQGNTHFPIDALFANCRPDGAFGIGGNVAQIQWDTVTGRVGARWADIHAVYNFLSNGNGLEYLKRRLSAYAGASVDTVWYGDTPGNTRNTHTALRGNVGIMGMLRTDDNHWEIRGLAGFRPNLTEWDDFSIEARTQIMYHMLFTRNILADFGIDAQYDHNTHPANSMGMYASDRDRDSGYLGAMFGITFQ